MPLTQKEAERVIAEGGSILLPNLDPLGDEGPATNMDRLAGVEFGDQVSLDSPTHPKNLAAAQRAVSELTGLPDPATDEEYQSYLRWKSAQARAEASGVLAPEETETETEEEPTEDEPTEDDPENDSGEPENPDTEGTLSDRIRRRRSRTE